MWEFYVNEFVVSLISITWAKGVRFSEKARNFISAMTIQQQQKRGKKKEKTTKVALSKTNP
jgi:hypothetical protein